MGDGVEAVEHYDRVYRFVRRRTRTREDAEDLTQTVFAEAAAAQDAPSVLAWLYTVARRRLIDEQRRRRSVVPLDDAGHELGVESTYGVDVAGGLARAIASLPEEQQRVVVLKLVEGRRFAEIARRLDVSEEACRARLTRALRTLRTELEKAGIAP